MNYFAPTRVFRSPEERLNKRAKCKLWYDLLRKAYDFGVSYPNFILNQLGLSFIPDYFSISPALCSMCTCVAFLAIISSVSIGLGVGLGVGLNCPKSLDYVSSNINVSNTTSSTISSIVNSTIGNNTNVG
ncbi:unnamed protein product [Rotaria magnacalcarata]|uniref:Uncharacterized protein n=1 Tax=Rotaria magnacalcarata TaxID=392030 RepID=A0A816SK44_9BILA|nr:unnamed protein product [Rotaria magnacalcarata]